MYAVDVGVGGQAGEEGGEEEEVQHHHRPVGGGHSRQLAEVLYSLVQTFFSSPTRTVQAFS